MNIIELEPYLSPIEDKISEILLKDIIKKEILHTLLPHNNLTPSIILLCINSIFICAMMEKTSFENIFSYKGDYYV